MKNKKNSLFSYIVILAVLCIPFMYSFFYLKAYWDPYGEGNIDNLPVAIVNEDKGSRGVELINSIKKSKKLKLSVVDLDEANDGLDDKTYYAVIRIPKDFSSSMESASTTSKKHATITYSPNQKSNYLASQIINNVVLNVEKSLDNSVNSAIVEQLSDNLNQVPEQLNTIYDGFTKLNEGTEQLKNGSNTLNQGISSLQSNYTLFHQGLNTLNEGANTLDQRVGALDSLTDGVNRLTNGVSDLKNGSNTLTSSLNAYVDGVSNTLGYTENLVALINATICPKVVSGTATVYEQQMCGIAQGLSQPSEKTGNTTVTNYLKVSGNAIKEGNASIHQGINLLNTNVSQFEDGMSKMQELKNAVHQIATGTNTLAQSSNQIVSGINALADGSHTLNNGISTLNDSVVDAKNTLGAKIEDTKKDLESTKGLSEYSKNPVAVDTKPVNEVSSYGTAFSPLFISIALWVGALMMYVVLYYDKENRFPKLSIDNQNYLQRTALYHLLATLSGILLAFLLNILLDFNITNYFLYYALIVLVANTFIAIIEFLIVNFKDVGKFIALIILVLQLAAAGGTFPIETVSKCFRFLNPILPMTYTINLMKEALITIESSLLMKNLFVVLGILIVLVIFNVGHDIYHDKKSN